jgi:hypothetical protein
VWREGGGRDSGHTRRVHLTCHSARIARQVEQTEHRAHEAELSAATLQAMLEADSSTMREYRADIDAATAAAGTMDGELSRLRTRMLRARQQATDAAKAVDQVRVPLIVPCCTSRHVLPATVLVSLSARRPDAYLRGEAQRH